MKLYLKNPLVLMLLCLITGMLMTISFLETPLKFQVPGITLPTALGLGKLMFGIFSKIQWGFLIVILVLMLISRRNYTKIDFILLAILILLLALEQFWLLPVLDSRVDLLSAGKALSPTPLHDYFIYAETAKALILITAIALQFKRKTVQ